MISTFTRYLASHWRGDLGLAVSWWVNCVTLTLCLWALMRGIAQATGWPAATTGGFFVWAALTGVPVVLVPVWQLTGLWRSADRRAPRPGTRLAGRTVQVLALLCTLAVTMRALGWAAEQAIGARLALAIGPYAWTVTLQPGGREIEVRGGLGYGVAAAVETRLAAAPGVRRIRLNSGGGALGEGQRLRAIILAHGLDTISDDGCASACVSAYIGGRFRYLQRGARIGVHLPRHWGTARSGGINPAYAGELRHFRQRGVPDWFLQRWIQTGQTMWYPPIDMLRAAGIVHFLRGARTDGQAEHGGAGDT